MSDPLTTGSERLAACIVPTREQLPDRVLTNRRIKDDPGIVTLVELVRDIKTAGVDYWSVAATAALKLWETGT